MGGRHLWVSLRRNRWRQVVLAKGQDVRGKDLALGMTPAAKADDDPGGDRAM